LADEATGGGAAALYTEADPAFGATGVVVGGGWRGKVFPAPDAESDDLVVPRVLVRPDDGGPALLVPRAMLEDQGDGTFLLPLDRAAASSYAAEPEDEESARLLSGERIVIPVLAETLSVGRRLVETGGGVRVTKHVHERAEVIEEPLLREDVTVERVPVNQSVDGTPPSQRQEGDTLILPILEEILVVEKRLLLREEVRITRQRRTVREPQTVTLREEVAEVERLAPGTGGAAGSSETWQPVPGAPPTGGVPPTTERTTP
jgi:uncharacterized protein (TIGR02271 family)